MTRDECRRAQRLATQLIARLSRQSVEQAIAIKLHGMLIPTPTPADVLQMILPAASVVDKCRLLGISRQQYYELRKGVVRPRHETMQRIAKATGLSADTLKAVW